MIHYSDTREINALDVARVFERSGINRPYKDLPRIQQMIDHANLIITAWADDKMVGIARASTDFSYCCYLSDLAVDRQYQNRGIGAELVKRVRDRIGDGCSLILIAAPSAVEYYPRLGFEQTDRAFLIPRKY